MSSSAGGSASAGTPRRAVSRSVSEARSAARASGTAFRIPGGVFREGRGCMTAYTVSSWRELDEAVADTSWCCHEHRVHSTLVFRGLARSSYRNISSLARLTGDYPALERHLLRNFRKYAHRERPGPTTWDWLALAQHHGLPTRLL